MKIAVIAMAGNTRPLKAQELRVNMQLSCENLLMFYNWVILKIVDSKVL
jgi:hypothetical protein